LDASVSFTVKQRFSVAEQLAADDGRPHIPLKTCHIFYPLCTTTR
jgi:hypothetical protein